MLTSGSAGASTCFFQSATVLGLSTVVFVHAMRLLFRRLRHRQRLRLTGPHAHRPKGDRDARGRVKCKYLHHLLRAGCVSPSFVTLLLTVRILDFNWAPSTVLAAD
jgi:hypothetical protein